MNVVTVAGPLGKDAEMRTLPNGDPVISFSVADSQGRDKPTIWWNAQMFGKRATALQQYLVKGQSVTVSGTVTEREWTNKEGGKSKTMEIRVNEIALQGGKREHSEPSPAPAPRQTKAKDAPGRFEPDDSDSIPF
jgi:single-strand DNA-binding protein